MKNTRYLKYFCNYNPKRAIVFPVKSSYRSNEEREVLRVTAVSEVGSVLQFKIKRNGLVLLNCNEFSLGTEHRCGVNARFFNSPTAQVPNYTRVKGVIGRKE